MVSGPLEAGQIAQMRTNIESAKAHLYISITSIITTPRLANAPPIVVEKPEATPA